MTTAAPAPTGLQALAAERPPSKKCILPALIFEFEATQSEPPLESIFLQKGGSIASAAERGMTDFALSGASESTAIKLSDEFSTVVRLPVPEGMVSLNQESA